MKDKNMDYFRAGMDHAWDVIQKDGVEELEKEIRFRNVTGINSRLRLREIDTGVQGIKNLSIKTVTALSVAVLYGEFGFGKKRIERFLDTFEKAVVDLSRGIVTWPDICENIEKLTHVRVGLLEDLEKVSGLFDDE